jgi:glutamate/aspartate transport system ATP-binding protein
MPLPIPLPMITIENVSKWYNPQFQVLKNCTTRVDKGEVVVVCGPSGSGKSTLIKTVNALEPVQQGTITIDGLSVTTMTRDLPKLRARVGMVFQHFELFPHLRIVENLCLGQTRVLGRSDDAAKAKAMKMLARVGLTDHAQKYPGQLSGGQQQRVAIARSMVNQPSLILLDEPTGAVDTETAEQLVALLKSLNEQDEVTIVVVTHDLDVAKEAKRQIRLKDGRVVADEAVAPVAVA